MKNQKFYTVRYEVQYDSEKLPTPKHMAKILVKIPVDENGNLPEIFHGQVEKNKIFDHWRLSSAALYKTDDQKYFYLKDFFSRAADTNDIENSWNDFYHETRKYIEENDELLAKIVHRNHDLHKHMKREHDLYLSDFPDFD